MLVQTMSPLPSLPSLGHRHLPAPSTRPLTIPRIKSAATALLRHGYRTPSGHAESKRQNSLNLACTLPDQALRRIFMACAAHGGSDSETWSWVSISYVCRNWRRIALQYPDLWRYLDFSNPQSYRLTWARGNMSSLHVCATVTDNNIRQLRRTLQLAHRIRDIHLRSPAEKALQLLDTLTYPNPSLESMIIDIQPSTEPSADMCDAPSFPTSYGGPPLRNLKYLELRNAPFYLFSNRCTHLTHLHLYDLPLTERPTSRNFLNMLAQLKYLRSLVLHHAFPINIEDADPPEQGLSLPHLQSITLVGKLLEITNTLDCVAIPPSAHLTAEISTLSNLTPAALRGLRKSISAFACATVEHEPLEILALTGHVSSAQRYTSAFQPNPEYRQSLQIRAFNSGSDAVIDLTLDPAESAQDDGLLITTLSVIWGALPLAHVHTIVLQDADIITQSSWNTFLRDLPRVRVIDIRGRAPSGLVWSLLLNARASRKTFKGKSRRVFVPRLEDVYVHNVDCSSGGFMVSTTGPVNSHRDLDDSRFLDVLIATLHQRRNFAFCLRSLSIARCSFVCKSMIEDARAAVSNLVWDYHSLLKEKDVDETFPARYTYGWQSDNAQLHHYHRLRALLQVNGGAHSTPV